MASLASRIRARFNFLFPPAPKPPKPSGKTSAPHDADAAARVRRRIVPNPIHPDFLMRVDPLQPIPEELLRKNAMGDTTLTGKLHPHTAFGRTGFGMVTIPENMTTPIAALLKSTHFGVCC